MSINNYILNLLNIKVKNFYILTNNLQNKKIKGKNYKIIEEILTYNPEFCPICGIINESTNDIIKWGFRKNRKIKIPKISNYSAILLLDKQRFKCKKYGKTFTASTDIIDYHKQISNNTVLSIKRNLIRKGSEKDIANILFC